LAPAPKQLRAGHPQSKPQSVVAQRAVLLKEHVQQNLLQISAGLFFVGCAGWCWVIYDQFRPAASPAPAMTFALAAKTDANIEKSDSFGISSYVRNDHPRLPVALDMSFTSTESAASVVAREWKLFAPSRVAERGSLTAKTAKAALIPAKAPIRLASLESAPQSVPAFRTPPAAVPSHVRPAIGDQTALVDFETAPFPYHGPTADLDRPFLNAGDETHRGHANFRGHVYWESQTFSDDRVLLHIPPGFDPSQPAVMVVFFHGHGATLARDVRDRQQVPAQITASGMNAVLVAPQFAVDAADSSSGKFWEPNGFKRFLDEAAVKLARLYGDPRRAAAFDKMPIVIVAYSGGFGPTLSVLDRGGVKQRIRGLVLLDALYAGIDRFADWIADNRSTFFVSAYTPHTAHHNTDLEQMLSARSVPYGSALRSNHLQGMVSFLPTGDISHRDFVNRAWAEYPIADILARMDNVDSKIAAPLSSRALASARE
jgi:hypothetical protein